MRRGAAGRSGLRRSGRRRRELRLVAAVGVLGRGAAGRAAALIAAVRVGWHGAARRAAGLIAAVRDVRFAAVVVVGAMAAVASVGTAGAQEPSEPVEPTALDAIVLENRTGVELVYLSISPRASASWGVNLLHPGDAVAPEARAVFYLARGGRPEFMDLLAIDRAGTAYIRWNHLVDAGDRVVVPVEASDRESGYDFPTLARLELVNESGDEIWYLFVAPDDSPIPGFDVLGARMILGEGESVVIEVPVAEEPARYRVAAVGATGAVSEIAFALTDRFRRYRFALPGPEAGASSRPE